MKITKKHFIDTESAYTDGIRDAIAINRTGYSYGLLPTSSEEGKSLELWVNCDHNQQIEVKVTHCQAVTPNGCRIAIARHPLYLKTSIAEIISRYNLPPVKDQSYNIVLSVNPFVRVPAGEPLLEEMPPRHPYTYPDYQMSIVPTTQVNHQVFHSAHLVIGRIHFMNGELKQAQDYIPPCTAVISYLPLTGWYNQFGKLLGSIENSVFRIIQKIKSKNQRITLTDSISFLMERLAFTLAEGLFTYQAIVPQQPPVYMISFLVKVAHNIKTVLSCLTDMEREEILGYFGEWSELTPGMIDQKLTTVIRMSYDHLELAGSLAPIHDLLSVVDTLFSTLSQLEYIPKRKGQAVFIVENPVPTPSQESAKPRWSPLA